MTKKEIIAEYVATYYGDIYNLKRELQQGDRVAVRCGLVDFLDYLAKDGRITERQRTNTTAPASWYK